MPIKFYSDALDKVIEPNYDAIPDETVEEYFQKVEAFEELLLTKKYFGIIYPSEGEEKENDN